MLVPSGEQQSHTHTVSRQVEAADGIVLIRWSTSFETHALRADMLLLQIINIKNIALVHLSVYLAERLTNKLRAYGECLIPFSPENFVARLAV